MCIVCDQFNPFGADGNWLHDNDRENSLAVTETTDAAAGIGTAYTMSAGDTFNGTLGFDGDQDWVGITLTAGVSYTIDMTAGTMADPYLWLFDSSGGYITHNDDSAGLNSQIVFTASSTGTYYIAADSFENNGGTSVDTGTYSVTVTVTEPADPLDSITWGDTAPAVINVFFVPGGVTFDDAYGAPQITSTWTAAEIAQAMEAFEAFENVADVTFNVVNDPNQADFLMVESTDPNSALGYWGVGGGSITANGTPYSGLDGWGVFYGGDASWTTAGLQQGGYAFITLIHEIGHGMGMAHPHDTGGSSTVMDGVSSAFGDFGDYDLNQGIYTTMSYNDGWQTAPHGASSSYGYGWQGTLMALDIAVMQDLYGANMSHNTGNDAYVLPSSNGAGTYYSSIWDAGGTDTIAHTGSAAAVIDLRAATLTYSDGGGGYVSYVEGIHGGFTIANGVVIERAEGGSSGDAITGNEASNWLDGNGGNDIILGGEGNDTIIGGGGNDMLTGEEGADIFAFVMGDNTMTMTDFEPGVDDLALVGLRDGFTVANLIPFISQVGDDVVIAAGGQQVVFEDTRLSELSAGDVIFV
ncbi:pre-peptidase C-terminal domain-containing protein [Roseovarius amoyensis]|uniref:pre-peptidase C-terminal domain-containing protein n=1 Tax=Roseovarius amoyensis TaxID=2211448 RepID=UPI000DBE8CAC|nr:M10 family metallopeptidase C-terminal domain-containing protein [Roseovarius amoyensis]